MFKDAKYLRRIAALALAAMFMFALSGCATSSESLTEAQNSGSGSTASETQGETENAQSASSGSNDGRGADNQIAMPDNPNILIAYFSRTGHVESMAAEIQNQIGGEMFRIAPATPYTEDINELSGIAQSELREQARPSLTESSPDIRNYDIIFVGYPCWWSDAPMPVYTFLEEGDYSGTIIVPFTSYGESGWGKSLSSIESSAPGATLAKGLAMQEYSMDNLSSDVSSWLGDIGLR